MAPATDLDPRLLGLQVQVAEARAKHQDLAERAELLERSKYYASAQVLKLRALKAENEWLAASKKLADYISKRQRGLHAKR